MDSQFKLHGSVQITHLNTRKEGPDDEKTLAVDVKFKAICPRQVIIFFDEQLEFALYTDIGAVRNTMIGPIPFKHELENYMLETMGGKHYGVRLKKFQIEPADSNQVYLTFQASFNPSGDEVATMAEYLQDDIQISLTPENAGLFDE